MFLGIFLAIDVMSLLALALKKPVLMFRFNYLVTIFNHLISLC